MPLKTTNTLPPGGWVYEQKGKDGKVIFKLKSMSPFTEACNEVLKIRKNNNLDRPSLREVMEDIEQATCLRLGNDPNWCESKKKPFSFNPVNLFRAAASHVQVAVTRSEQVRDGIAILQEWFGDGAVPVSAQLSQERAEVCFTCPFNKPGFKPIEAVAAKIKEQAEKKNELKLTVLGEEKLHTCDCCWCFLPLKVHVPLPTILSQTPKPMLNKFRQQQPRCWIVTEQQTQLP